jgi:hypothetical protein
MAANYLPYGLRDVKLTPISAAGAYGTMVDLPVSRTLSFTESEDFTDLRGDDSLVASRGSGPSVSWDLEAGGISLEAYAVIAGGTVTASGVTPNQKKSYTKTGDQSRPYFMIEGKSINDNGGDTHCVIYRAKATGDLTGEMSDGAFLLTAASGTGFPDTFHANKVYDWINNETEAAIVQPV